MSVEEKLQEMIIFHRRTTGNNPDALFLESADFNEFISEISRHFVFQSMPPTEESVARAMVFQGIPVKEFQVTRP